MGAEQMTAAGAGADRRRQLLDRLADVIAESGMEGVSIRTLAARAEVSIGTVQYYFSTKDELLHRVWEYVRDEAEQRLDLTALAQLSPRERLNRFLGVVIPSRSDDRLARVWLALVARAAHHPDTAELHRGQWRRVQDLIERLLVAAAPAGIAESGDAAAELLALADGLTLAVLTEPDRMPPERALRITHAWVDRWASRPPAARG